MRYATFLVQVGDDRFKPVVYPTTAVQKIDNNFVPITKNMVDIKLSPTKSRTVHFEAKDFNSKEEFMGYMAKQAEMAWDDMEKEEQFAAECVKTFVEKEQPESKESKLFEVLKDQCGVDLLNSPDMPLDFEMEIKRANPEDNKGVFRRTQKKDDLKEKREINRETLIDLLGEKAVNEIDIKTTAILKEKETVEALFPPKFNDAKKNEIDATNNLGIFRRLV